MKAKEINFFDFNEINKEEKWKIPTGQLNSIEFSDQLCCIRFIGSVTVTYTGSNLRLENKSVCYFYVEKGYEKEILSELTRTCEKDIIYRNR